MVPYDLRATEVAIETIIGNTTLVFFVVLFYVLSCSECLRVQ